MKHLLLVIGLAAALAGCTQKSDSPVTTAPASGPATTESAAPEASAPVAEAPAQAPAPAAVSRAAARPIPGTWKLDTHYELIVPAVATTVDAGQVEIIEFMWLGCSHCYELNPYIEAWRGKLPAYVAFRQEHVTWGPQQLPHARLFYTLQALGAGNAPVVKAFDEIHRKRNILMAASAAESEQLQQAFAVTNGLDAAAFQRAYNGFTVNTSVKRADDLIRRYRVEHVPTLIVNGRYRTDVSMAGGPEKLMQLLTDLAASETGN